MWSNYVCISGVKQASRFIMKASALSTPLSAVLALFLIYALPCSSDEDIPPSRCSYNGYTMTCTRLPRGSSFPSPDLVKSGISTYIFTDCHFNTLPTVPYNETAVRLIIRNSDVTTIPDGAFSGLGKLRYLEVSSNFVRDINKETFRGLSKLNFLILSHNQLQELGNDLLEHLPKLDKLDVTGNPYISFHVDLLTPAT